MLLFCPKAKNKTILGICQFQIPSNRCDKSMKHEYFFFVEVVSWYGESTNIHGIYKYSIFIHIGSFCTVIICPTVQKRLIFYFLVLPTKLKWIKLEYMHS